MSAVSFWSPVEVHNDKMPLITGDREQIKDKRWHKQKVKRYSDAFTVYVLIQAGKKWYLS